MLPYDSVVVSFGKAPSQRLAHPKDETTPVRRTIIVNAKIIGIIYEQLPSPGFPATPEFVCWWKLTPNGVAIKQMDYGCSGYRTLESAMGAARKKIKRDLANAYALLQAGW